VGLREQLLKAGLVNKKQAKQAEAQARKQEHDKLAQNKAGKEALEKEQAEMARLEKEAEEKREADRLRNLEIEASRKEREKVFRALQLLRSNRLNEPHAQMLYFFVEKEVFVRKILVNEYQKEMLARGKLAIAKADEDVDEYTLIPSHTARTILTLAPEKLLVLHPPLDDAQELKVD
jgi:uncharacterized protein